MTVTFTIVVVVYAAYKTKLGETISVLSVVLFVRAIVLESHSLLSKRRLRRKDEVKM